MPSPAVYVVAVVAGVAAGLAFKEFIYDPHLAPKIEEWATSFAAYRRERRRRRAFPYARSDDGSGKDDDGSPGRGGDGEHKPGVELTRIVEREMQDISREGSLRHRQPQTAGPGDDDVQMLEKPNAFIPFEPLSPTTTRVPSASFSPSLSKSVNYSDAALPIGHLPTPGSVGTLVGQPRQGTSAAAAAASLAASTLSQATQSEVFLTPRGPGSAASGGGSAQGSPAPSRTASEYDYVLSASASASEAEGSRATTPFTDARSETPFDELLGSEAGSSSDAELLAAAYASDAEAQPGGDVDLLRLPRLEGQSEIGSEDWERVSEAGRSSF